MIAKKKVGIIFILYTVFIKTRFMNTIKKLIFPLALIVIFAACKSNSKEDSRNIQLLSDSTAYRNNVTTDSVKGNATSKAPSDYRYHSKETVKSSATSDKTDVPSAKGSASSTSTTSTNSKTSTASSQNTSAATEKTTKKGWSKAAQGAAIGGAAGAVGGAIISKHKGTGAAIGAAVGAASGYIIGKDRDKKDKK